MTDNVIYRAGKPIPVREVTWADLCDSRTYVPEDIDWSELPDKTLYDRAKGFGFLVDFCSKWA